MDGKALNIVLIEDDVIDVMNVRRAFQKANITAPLFVAGDGIEGLALLRSQSLAGKRRLVLLDLNMPRMTGIEFLREVRRDAKLRSESVVVLTTSGDDADKREAYRLNVAGYLLKPVVLANFVELMAALHRFWSLVEMP